ncbi:glycosyltransferase family 2 protein [Gloeothece verrucosa]|uniref:Glycosyl transferase family 2 n=1 Tax=Gloeothece verrucosa (strain PCC 7822) TaxID=497965 RepID=E0UNB2_GLOV7|nr:glycosyltransferase [Gloeothece verrucosa]ADN18442.1 glycosyl transferase family 2 [Gloeothece verrucosa PCC 7822]
MSLSPFMSIVIPTYNRCEALKTCLDSIACLKYPRERFEIIIVDDGSKDPLDNLVNPYREQLHIKLIRQTNAGPAQARNTGANAASGEYLAFTDDDCILDENWLCALENGFSKTPNALLGGKTLNTLVDNPYSTASQLFIDYLYDYYNTKGTQATFFASNNFAIYRKLFDQVGQFDISFSLAAGEDREFCDRWLSSGYSLCYIPNAIIYHSHHLSLGKFWRQHYNYGCGAYCFHQLRSQGNKTSLKFQPLTFYWKLITYPLTTQSSPFPSLFLCSLLLLSQLANIFGFFTTKIFQPEIRKPVSKTI